MNLLSCIMNDKFCNGTEVAYEVFSSFALCSMNLHKFLSKQSHEPAVVTTQHTTVTRTV